MASPLPQTPQSAPPNFYSQVGSMAAGQGNKPAASAAGGGSGAAQSGQGQAGAGGAAGQPTPSDQFLEMVPKLKKVLQQMKELQPNGQDVSKYMDAMDSTLMDCVTHVFGGADQTQTPGADTATTAAAPPAPPPPPQGATQGGPPAQ